MKTKSTVGRLITRLSEWRESGARVAAMTLLLLVAGTNAVKASDWVLNEDKYLHLNYAVMHGFEIAGLQDHETRLRQAEREIAALKRENAELKARITNN